MNKKEIPRITKCDNVVKMTNDEIMIMILQQRIDKAIEYIKNIIYINEEDLEIQKEKAISILRGEDNE